MIIKTQTETLTDRFPEPDIPGLDFLNELALDLSWRWNHAADEIWEALDQPLWELTHNPWVVLQTVSSDNIRRLLSDPGIQSKLATLQLQRPVSNTNKWFQENYPDSPLSCIAYFSMEYMLTEGLPIYSGGLGNVAGDQLKAAHDMGLPMVGIGLLYQQGYFHQLIARNGEQLELYPYNEPGQLPIMPLRKDNGEWLRIQISLPGYAIWLRTWEVKVGQVKLYLLDSNDVANYPAHRGITSELYGGGGEIRFLQEMFLGIGGWRLLKELGITPEVCHLNEGHAAFLILERARDCMKQTGLSFYEALTVTRAGNLFTTHTAVTAGFDLFAPYLVAQYLSAYAQTELGISFDELMALGRANSNDPAEPFNMAYLAIRGAGAVNGVSRLHRSKSREIFRLLFPRWPDEEIPIGYVTNGVHMRSWDSKAADEVWTATCSKGRWMGTLEKLELHMCCLPDERLWNMRTEARKTLIEFIRKRLPLDLAASGASPQEVQGAKSLFDFHTLTLGFARRFATYKRPNLLLYDQERLLRILTHAQTPVQIVVAGKAHPADEAGQAMIKEWVEFSKRPEARDRVVFLSDDDLFMTEQMIGGVDVWLNTPRRPWEACGTSGMKALVNGVINFSELDGWWDEAYEPGLGWALGDGQEHGDDPQWDAVEANQLYTILEKEIIPAFYQRNENDIPLSWTSFMRRSMAELAPRFSTNRAIIEYSGQYYLPAAAAFKKRWTSKGAFGVQIHNRKQTLHENWHAIKFLDIQIDKDVKGYQFRVTLLVEDSIRDYLSVELCANAVEGLSPERITMKPVAASSNEQRKYTYQAQVETNRPENDYTVRIVPGYEGVAVPLEDNLILWQR